MNEMENPAGKCKEKKKKRKDKKSKELTEEEIFEELTQQDLEDAYIIFYDEGMEVED